MVLLGSWFFLIFSVNIQTFISAIFNLFNFTLINVVNFCNVAAAQLFALTDDIQIFLVSWFDCNLTRSFCERILSIMHHWIIVVMRAEISILFVVDFFNVAQCWIFSPDQLVQNKFSQTYLDQRDFACSWIQSCINSCITIPRWKQPPPKFTACFVLSWIFPSAELQTALLGLIVVKDFWFVFLTKRMQLDFSMVLIALRINALCCLSENQNKAFWDKNKHADFSTHQIHQQWRKEWLQSHSYPSANDSWHQVSLFWIFATKGYE